MFRKKKYNIHPGLESILALNEAIKGSPDIDAEDSENNIIKNLVSIAILGGTSDKKPEDKELIGMRPESLGTGFRLTTDGFILTAYHNISPYEEHWDKINSTNPLTNTNALSWFKNIRKRYAIIDEQKDSYAIDTTFWTTCPNLDIALIKAVSTANPNPINFRVAAKELKVGDEIRVLGLKDQRLYSPYGKVISAGINVQISEGGDVSSTTYETFLTDAYGMDGISGGVFVTSKKELAGTSLYINHTEGSRIGYVGGAKAKNIIEFLRKSSEAFVNFYNINQ